MRGRAEQNRDNENCDAFDDAAEQSGDHDCRQKRARTKEVAILTNIDAKE
jgi:hypothetical protein